MSADIPLAPWARSSAPSAIQDMLALTSQPGLLSLALGLPAAELFPTAAYGEALTRVLAADPRALQYEIPSAELRRQVAALMEKRGVRCDASQVFLTAGAQQGMSLLAGLLLEPGATVLLEEKAYSGFQQAIAPHAPQVIAVPTDIEAGIDVDALERILAGGARPALLYAMSDGHNPLGVSLGLDARRRLAELARAYRVPIVEDDAYGFLSYERDALPPIRAFEDRWVLYIGSFSKILAPALRVGWLVVPEELVRPLSILKEASDINTATLAQRGVSAYLATGALDGHLEALRRAYRARRDAMLRALRACFPPGARWSTPSAGMFVWVDLPAGIDAMRLLAVAVERRQVAFLPGQAFWVDGGPRPTNGLRLNFSWCDEARIEDGVRRVAEAIEELAR